MLSAGYTLPARHALLNWMRLGRRPIAGASPGAFIACERRRKSPLHGARRLPFCSFPGHTNDCAGNEEMLVAHFWNRSLAPIGVLIAAALGAHIGRAQETPAAQPQALT